MLAARPHLVRLDLARPFIPRYPSQYLESDSLRGVDWYVRTSRVSPTGVLGDPTRASRRKGERIWQVTIRHLVAFVETVKSLSLDELHERKF